MDVLELYDGSSTFSSICNQYGLRTGERVSLQGRFSQPSYYAERWNTIVTGKPILLYIEPPRVTDLPEQERRPVALFLS